MKTLKEIKDAIKEKGGIVIEEREDGISFRLQINVKGLSFFVIACNGGIWDHVSVSTKFRVPNWDEMCFIKRLCFQNEENAYQIHPAEKDYINCHPYVLHLWRPQTKQIPMPDKIMV